jgi:hypothetical protein
LKILASASGSTASSVCTRIARSAPIASAVRSVSCAFAGPTLTTTISVATPFSLRRIASSTRSRRTGSSTSTPVDIGKVNARAVGLDPRLDVIIEHPLDGDEDFHAYGKAPLVTVQIVHCAIIGGFT